MVNSYHTRKRQLEVRTGSLTGQGLELNQRKPHGITTWRREVRGIGVTGTAIKQRKVKSVMFGSNNKDLWARLTRDAI